MYNLHLIYKFSITLRHNSVYSARIVTVASQLRLNNKLPKKIVCC